MCQEKNEEEDLPALKTYRKTNYIDQKPHKQHKNQQNNNN